MRYVGISVVASAAILLTADTALAQGRDQASAAPARLELTADGPMLVTKSGMTLYIQPADKKTGTSTCTKSTEIPNPATGLTFGAPVRDSSPKSCADKWPAFLAAEGAKPVGEFTLVDRPNGEGGRQWAFRGQPLYLSIKDKKAGDRNAVTSCGPRNRDILTYDQFGGVTAFQFASVPPVLAPGAALTRYNQDIVLATQQGKAMYTAPEGRLVRAAAAGGYDPATFKPVTAGASASLAGRWNSNGDWSMVQTAPGLSQFAFRKEPLYIAPDSLDPFEIEELGWKPIVYTKGPALPSAIKVRLVYTGEIYTDAKGHTLYMFACDDPRRPMQCNDPGDPAAYLIALCGSAKDCAARWRPYLADDRARPAGLWSVVEVPNPLFVKPDGTLYPKDAPRVKVWAFRGNPLYTYAEDKKPGDILGHGVKWNWGTAYFGYINVPARQIGQGLQGFTAPIC